MLYFKYSGRKSWFTNSLTLSWCTVQVPGLLRRIRPWNHMWQSSHLIISLSSVWFSSSIFSELDSEPWSLFDLEKTSVYAVCDDLQLRYRIIICGNRSDVLMGFVISVFRICSVWFHSSIRQWNTDCLRYVGRLLFAREHDQLHWAAYLRLSAFMFSDEPGCAEEMAF